MTGKQNRASSLLRALLVILLATFVTAGTALAEKNEPPQATPEGLTLAKNTKHRLVYLADDVDFGVYDKVYIVDCAVAFAKNWQRDYNRNERDLSRKVKDKDVERIKNNVAAEFKKVFTETMIDHGLEVVTETGPGVIVLRPAIINLVVNAPDVQSATRSRTYTADAGQMTLYLELYDGVSGAMLAEAMDAQSASRNAPYITYSNRATNIQEADRILKRWANEIAGHFHVATDEVMKDQGADSVDEDTEKAEAKD
jgi:hypothetical protein